MDCQQARTLMDGYLDDELDGVSRLVLEQHLADCPLCQSLCQQRRTLSAAIGAQASYHRARPALAEGIRAALDNIDRVSGTGRRPALRWVALAASAAFAALLGSGLTYWLDRPAPDALLTQEVIASHVRAQMVAGRLTDISSSDQHTVKPWFNGKLDFAPPVQDLTDQGFPLVGGRLDYLAGRPVAALVYRHRQHFIQLFVWPRTEPGNRTPRLQALRGYQVLHWSDTTMNYWVVSDLNPATLQIFGELLQGQAVPD